jgi:hypothetical protein
MSFGRRCGVRHCGGARVAGIFHVGNRHSGAGVGAQLRRCADDEAECRRRGWKLLRRSSRCARCQAKFGGGLEMVGVQVDV